MPVYSFGKCALLQSKSCSLSKDFRIHSFPQNELISPSSCLLKYSEILRFRYLGYFFASFYFVLRAPKGHPEESLGENTQFTAPDKTNVFPIVSFPGLYCKNNWGVGEGRWTCGGSDGRQPWVVPLQSPVAPFLSLPIKLLQILYLHRITRENPL